MMKIIAMNNPSEVIQKIIDECYWDYGIADDDILNIVETGQFREKQKLFTRILFNSEDKLKSLTVFHDEDLKPLFDSFSTKYNYRLISKHVAALRNILLHENNPVEGIAWKKR